MGFKNSAAAIINTVAFLVFHVFFIHKASGKTHHHRFVVESSSYTRLCSTKDIVTVNGKFPGPTIKAHKGDTLIIRVYNMANYNITLHWHGVRQKRNPWSDGAEYVTQCPIRPRNNFTYKVELSGEEGTVWWHAHSGWARATVHGAIIVYPKPGTPYPFPMPYKEIPMILGEWWKQDVMSIPGNANKTGGEPILSNAFTMNGQPGDFYPCSKQESFKLNVEHGKTYLLRIINAVMDENLFFAIAKHSLTVVGTDGSYTKPLNTTYLMITPGQSMDVLLHANQDPTACYYVAARSYADAVGAGFDNSTTTAQLRYQNWSGQILSPTLPPHNSTRAATSFANKLRSLASKHHPAKVPLKVDTHLLITISVNLVNCTADEAPCTGPLGRRFSASMNNISFVTPSIDILRAYYYGLHGVFNGNFPRNPQRKFNFTGDNLPENFLTPDFGTKALVLEYNAGVELVLQGTNVLASDNHPMHLHGYSFFVVGSGYGNFDPKRDPLRYNLIDPPEESTVGVPKDGWVALRFKANNPGVWLMHCHLERHQTWGMSMVLVVKNGATPGTRIMRPPHDLPKC